MRSFAFLIVAAMLLLGIAQVSATSGYSVSPTTTKTITEWNVCRRVTNGHASSKDLFVPTQLDYEWINSPTSFVSATPPGVTLANCVGGALRFRGANSNYLSRTFSSPTNNRIWTWSGWVERGTLSSVQKVFTEGSSGTEGGFWFTSGDAIEVYNYSGGYNYQLVTTPVFRDPNAWYHIVVAADYTQGTASNRLKLYVNGQQVTSFSTASYPSNQDYLVNSANVHALGRVASTNYFDGYLADVYFVDGQQLTPSSFAQSNATTSMWEPVAYTGGYGTNGFHLTFDDTSNNTATTMGADSSGNGNNWTPTNFSLTTGTAGAYDAVQDHPLVATNGDNGRANYATINPLGNATKTALSSALANANLTFTTASNGGALGSFSFPVGKWYFEATASAVNTFAVGIASDARDLTADPGTSLTNYWGFYFNPSKNWITNGSNPWASGSFTTSDVAQFAVDATNPASVTFWVGVNNTWFTSAGSGTASPSTASNPTATIASNVPLYPYVANRSAGGTSTVHLNFGQRPFIYTPPTGFLPLNSYNMPAPSIVTPSAYFSATTYTGTGSALSITGVGFQPDLVWIKSRSGATSHALFDSVRGVQKGLALDTTAEQTASEGVTAFNADGFTIGTSSTVNTNGATYVAWMWKQGVTPGFDIVTYTGTGSNRTIAHNLGAAPKFVLVKNRNPGAAYNWVGWHTGIAGTQYVGINTANAAGTDATQWNSTVPTSSVFSVGSAAHSNESGKSFVAYLWTDVPGFSKFSTYTGNGSADGPFVYTGFRPAFILVRSITTGYNWVVLDNVRNAYNPATTRLIPNLTDAEGSDVGADFLANGFKLRTTAGAMNQNGDTYIYAAFAEQPFKYSRAR